MFTSGYVSNWAALGTLASCIPDCVVLSDAGNHASMIEGIRHSRAERHIFKHNDLADLTLDIQGAIARASDDKARSEIIHKLRHALERP